MNENKSGSRGHTDRKQAQVANIWISADWIAGEKIPDQAVLSKGEKQSRALVYKYEFWHDNLLFAAVVLPSLAVPEPTTWNVVGDVCIGIA